MKSNDSILTNNDDDDMTIDIHDDKNFNTINPKSNIYTIKYNNKKSTNNERKNNVSKIALAIYIRTISQSVKNLILMYQSFDLDSYCTTYLSLFYYLFVICNFFYLFAYYYYYLHAVIFDELSTIDFNNTLSPFS